MVTIEQFYFLNPFVPAAFVVAGLLISWKFQWQGFFYMMVVINAPVTTIPQFMLINLLLVVTLIVPGFVRSAAADKSK